MRGVVKCYCKQVFCSSQNKDEQLIAKWITLVVLDWNLGIFLADSRLGHAFGSCSSHFYTRLRVEGWVGDDAFHMH